MSEADERIARFRKMAEADPGNELGHFSLGKALLDVGQPADAVPSLRRVIELNPRMSKAYQHLAEALRAIGERVEAVSTLRAGLKIARERGDMMPAKAIADMLRDLGEEADEPAGRSATGSPAAGAGTAGGGFRCRRCGGGEQLPDPPMRGETGQLIFQTVCRSCWREWIGMGTKVINELRLDLRDPQSQQAYDMHMREFLGL